MRMLRCMCEVTNLDSTINEIARGTTTFGKISKIVQERCLKWYGRVMRREERYVGKMAMEMEAQWRRKTGKPKKIWLDRVKDAIEEKRRSGEKVHDCVTRRRIYNRQTSTLHTSVNTMKSKKVVVGCGRWQHQLLVFLC